MIPLECLADLHTLWDMRTFEGRDLTKIEEAAKVFECSDRYLYNSPAFEWNLAENARTHKLRRPLTAVGMSYPNSSIMVAGSGPSLRRNLHYMHALRARGHQLVAVDSAWKTLVENELFPDITITIDPGMSVADMFPEPLLRHCPPGQTFAACHVTHSSVLWRLGNKTVFSFGCINPYSTFWRLARAFMPAAHFSLISGGIVTVPAVHLAVLMGADRVITIGNELCWPTLHDVPAEWKEDVLLMQNHVGMLRPTIPPFADAANTELPGLARLYGDHVEFLDASGGVLPTGWTATNLEHEVLT